MTYLQPVSLGLHAEDNAGIWLGQSVPVADAFTGETQLHFTETRAA